MFILKDFITVLLVLFFSACNQVLAQPHASQNDKDIKTIISGFVETPNDEDTVILNILSDIRVLNGVMKKDSSIKVLAFKGSFKIEMPSNIPSVYFTLEYRPPAVSGIHTKKVLLKEYYLNPGDDIHIYMDSFNQLFTGKGSAKFRFRYKLLNTLLPKKQQELPPAKFSENVNQWIDNLDTLLSYAIYKLELFKDSLPEFDYIRLKYDIEAENRLLLYYSFRLYGFAGMDSLVRNKAYKVYKEKLFEKAVAVDSSGVLLSGKFPSYLFYKMLSDYRFKMVTPSASDKEFFPEIKKLYSGLLREKVIMQWLYVKAFFGELSEKNIDDAITIIQKPEYILLITDMKQTFGVGQPVMDFKFENSIGKIVTLSDFKGKMILMDFWFTGCGACTYVAKELKEVENALASNKDIVFVSVSVDKDKTTWLHSISSNVSTVTGFPFTGVYYSSDNSEYLYTGGRGTSDPFIKKYIKGGYPVLLLIDKDGNILSANPPLPWPKTDGAKMLIKMICDNL